MTRGCLTRVRQTFALKLNLDLWWDLNHSFETRTHNRFETKELKYYITEPLQLTFGLDRYVIVTSLI